MLEDDLKEIKEKAKPIAITVLLCILNIYFWSFWGHLSFETDSWWGFPTFLVAFAACFAGVFGTIAVILRIVDS